ncbi:hypothetical protein AQUCO_00300511v1 [Aquilegia coerulea]|uniref:Uncharacterized protein n=1 Tax=Aquilegia coerulea TaxID=218851 RepID=A0A2G5EZ77_AQUCA|nr:hypothetical protein AQUCO_00300511v1 [Aquilegia coerulea]
MAAVETRGSPSPFKHFRFSTCVPVKKQAQKMISKPTSLLNQNRRNRGVEEINQQALVDVSNRTPDFAATTTTAQEDYPGKRFCAQVVYAEDLVVEIDGISNVTQVFKTPVSPETIFKVDYGHQVEEGKQADIRKQNKRSWSFLGKVKSLLRPTKTKFASKDIDAADSNNVLGEVGYVEDIYQCYKLLENSTLAKPGYMDEQQEMDEKMRASLVDWLIDVQFEFKLVPETLYLTIHIVDRYLSTNSASPWLLKLLGLSAMLIASKYEQQDMIHDIDDFVSLADYVYSQEEIVEMEKLILKKIDWRLTDPTPYVFLVRYIKAAAAVSDMEKMEDMAFFLAELGLIHYELVVRYSPSMLAASSVYAARCTLKIIPFWNETLMQHTGYSESQILDCARRLVHFHSMAEENNLWGICTKYSDTSRGAVALLPPAEILSA